MSGISERNPFVGPRPIQQGEALHGRETEISELYDRLQARRIVVLHSPSGAGKSSLIHAGLIPHLQAARFDVWRPIRVNLDPSGFPGVPADVNRFVLSVMVSLEEELPTEHRRNPAQLAALSLSEYLKTRPRRKSRENRSVVLLFDQFEEVLTVDSLERRPKHEFFQALGQSLLAETYWALFVVREDYLAAFAPYREHLPSQMANTFRIDLLGVDDAREVAVKLAAQGGRTFPAVDKLVNDLSTVQVQQADGHFVAKQGPHVEPVHLQVVCRRLWEAMPDDDLSIDPEDLEAYAGVSQALAEYYSAAVLAIAGNDFAVQRAIREWVGRQLIVGGIRSQVRQDAGTSAGLDNKLIQGLLDRYLVRTEERAGANWFELSHDRLVDPVQKNNKVWERANLHPLQVQAKIWESGKRARSLLLGAVDLRGALAWAKNNPRRLTDAELEFLEQSRLLRAEEARARRAQWITTGVIGVIAVAAIGLFVWGIGQQTEAERSAKVAHEAEEIAVQEAREAKVAREAATASAKRANESAYTAQSLAWMYYAQNFADTDPTRAITGLRNVHDPKPVGWHQHSLAALQQPITYTLLHADDDDHDDEVSAADLSGDARRVVLVSGARARVLGLDGTGESAEFQAEGGIRSVSFSPDGERIAVTSSSGNVSVWDVSKLDKPLGTKALQDKSAVSASLSTLDRGRIVTAWEDNRARVWRLDEAGQFIGKPIELRGHAKPLTSVSFSVDGKHIVTTSRDRDALVWRGSRFQTRPVVLHGHFGDVVAASFSRDGKRVVTASRDDTARVWQVRHPTLSVVLRGHQGDLLSASFDATGEQVITTSVDGTARVWNSDGSGEPLLLQAHGETIMLARFLPQAEGEQDVWHERFITVSDNGTVRRWSADGWGTPVLLKGHERLVTCVNVSHEGSGNRVVTSSKDGTARVWTLDAAGEAASVVLVGHEGPVWWASFSPDDKRIVTASADGTARVWSAEDGSEQFSLQGHRHPVVWASFNRAGDRIITASWDGSARVWNADGTGNPVPLLGHGLAVLSATISPDGQRIATSSRDGTTRVWNLDGSNSSDPVVLEGHGGAVVSASFSPDGQRIVTASADSTARVWTADEGRELLVLPHLRGLASAVFSASGQHVITVTDKGSSDTAQVRVWESMHASVPILLQDDAVSATFSADGKYVLTAASNGRLRRWDADASDEEPLALGVWDDSVVSATLLPGERILSHSTHGGLRLWTFTELELNQRLREATTLRVSQRDCDTYFNNAQRTGSGPVDGVEPDCVRPDAGLADASIDMDPAPTRMRELADDLDAPNEAVAE